MARRLTTAAHVFTRVYDDHVLRIAAAKSAPIQLTIQPVGVERIDGVDLTPQQTRMIIAVLTQALAAQEGELP